MTLYAILYTLCNCTNIIKFKLNYSYSLDTIHDNLLYIHCTCTCNNNIILST